MQIRMHARHIADLALALQLPHCGNQLLSVAGCQGTALLQDGCQLAIRDVLDMELEEARAEGSAQGLASGISTRRVLGGKKHEVRVRLNDLLQLRYVKFPIVIQQPADSVML